MNEFYKKLLNESQTPFDETLDYVVNSILNNVKNKEAVLDKIAPKIRVAKYAVHFNPFDRIKKDYFKWKNSSFAVRYFNALEPFDYKGMHIDPDHSLKTLIDSAEEVGAWIKELSASEYDSKFSRLIQWYTNRKLQSFGITNPDSAPIDLKTAAIYIKEYLKRLVNETPKLYS